MGWNCKQCEALNSDELHECEVCGSVSPFISGFNHDVVDPDKPTTIRWKAEHCLSVKLDYDDKEVDVTRSLSTTIPSKEKTDLYFYVSNENADRKFTYTVSGDHLLFEEKSHRIAREKAEAERIAREKAEAKRIAREKAEAKRKRETKIKCILFVLIVAAILLGLKFCFYKPIDPPTITINAHSLSMTVGETKKLTANVKNWSDKQLKWDSSNHDVATVSTDGNVTAKNEGESEIWVCLSDGKTKNVCKVSVKAKTEPIVSINPSSLSMTVGETKKLTANVINWSNKQLKWKSSNSDVATVSTDGNVTAKNEGEAEIWVCLSDGKTKNVCKVSVKAKPEPIVSICPSSLSMTVGETKKLTANVKNWSNKQLKWESSNHDVATVSTDGNVTAKNEGESEILVCLSDGKTKDVCKVSVKAKPVKPEHRRKQYHSGDYFGPLENGIRQGTGKFKYTKKRIINKYDLQEIYACPGDYVEGIFYQGFFVEGKLHRVSGEIIDIRNTYPQPGDYDKE